MANTYNWYSTASSCPDAANPKPGWYSGSTFITASYTNPSTGAAYTPQELQGLAGGGIATTPTTPNGYTPMPSHPGFGATPEEHAAAQEEYISGGWGAGQPPTAPPGYIEGQQSPHPGTDVATTTPGTTGLPTFGEGTAAGIPTPEVTPAPAYEISQDQQDLQDQLGSTISDWVAAGGYGLAPEVQAQMIQQQTDSLKAREQENIRVMKNNMERRGITNSGFLFANEQAIRSNTSVAIAGAISDVQINSALMKMASFEKAMGQAGQFLGYLSEQSQLKYAPEFATWQAEQMATMQAWQGKLDVYKMEINQAYQTQNMKLQAQLTSQLNAEQNQYDLQLMQMEIDYAQEAAKAEAGGSISGSVVTGLFALGAAFL